MATDIAPVLLISPDGMLGRAWDALLRARGIPFEGVSFPGFDITRQDHVAAAVSERIATVINCSAFTDVDGAETRQAEADAINGHGVSLLAERCKHTGALLVQYSTDYVFDGNATTPYPVDATRAPQGAYGHSKALGEERLQTSGCHHLLVRTSWLYAPWGKNFVDTIAKLGAERPELRVVDDQRGRPTSAEYLAARTLALIEHGATGAYHVTDGDECTWFEFATEICRLTQGRAQVHPCTTAEFPRPAPRPAYSVLDLSKTEAMLGPSRPWRSNLADVIAKRSR
jgi:dTDP-4-dehydrorhamnose reductase